ncbi:hypothetical protein LCGC14_2905060 [marine sediment metagenome]|uniref:Uncharacterized protein n=1 Tax=marine sediment metagenome TaxID=412755 RepID=A0A0F8XT75_9ZZZZ
MKLVEILAPRFSLVDLTYKDVTILRTIAGRTTGGGPGREFVDKLYKALTDIEPNNDTGFVGDFSFPKKTLD